MTLQDLRRRRVPLGLALVVVSLWMLAGLKRSPADGWAAVLDSRLGFMTPRQVGPGWHLTPPGLLRLTLYPIRPVTLEITTSTDPAPLLTREGTAVDADLTLRYQVEPSSVLAVHRSLGPRFEHEAIGRLTREVLRHELGAADYAAISGARTEELQAVLSGQLTDRFRESGLLLLSCEVRGPRIRHSGSTPVRKAAGGDRRRVLFVGLDGADWDIVDPMIQSGALPHLARLTRQGTRVRLRTISPMLSPVIWTSMATGVVPARHGILDFVALTEREGERIPVTSTQRRVKAIWNLLSDSGLSVGIVGWWATYPAEAVHGFIVSDRVAYQLFGARPIEEQDRRSKVHPAEADTMVQSLTVAPESITVADLAPFLRLPPDPGALSEVESRMVDDFKTLLASGRTYIAAALALSRRYKPDFTAVYLEGTDTVAHLFMPYAPPPMQGIEAEARQRFGRAVDAYYRHADAELGRLIEALQPDCVIVASDHGFRTGDNRPLTESRIGYGGAADWHRKYGLLILSGPPFRKGVSIEEASILDITPTLLRLYGLPVGEDMDGRPVSEAFEPEFLRSHPESYIPSWETGVVAGTPIPRPAVAAGPEPDADPDRGASDPVGDAERIEKLRSLGYLAATPETANAHNNRGTILLGAGRYDEALAEFRKAVAASEDLTIARLNIARALYRKKDYPGAIEALNEHLKRQPRSKEAENLFGNIAMDEGRLADAETHLQRALSYEPNFADARNSLGLLYQKQGRDDEALAEFRRVVAVDRDYAEGYNNIGVILKERGSAGEAIEAFRRAIAADPEFAGSYSNLALMLEQKGDLKAAEEQYHQALRREPSNVAARTNFGGLLYTTGRFEEARRELLRATELDPAYASAWNNLGAVLGRLGRAEEEMDAYRKAATLDPESADVHHNLGLALIKRGQGPEGESELRRALALQPGYVAACINLSRYLAGSERVDEAAALLEQGIRSSPKDVGLRVVYAQVAARQGRVPAAIAALEEALRLNPNQPDVIRDLEMLRSRGAGEGAQPEPTEPSEPR